MLESILPHALIPVVEIESAHSAPRLAEAFLEGGVSIIEITLRTQAAVDSIAAISKTYPEMLVGAGTVLTLEEASRVRDAGARFGIAPGLNPTIVEDFHASGVPFLPGVVTPSEIERAIGLGCRLLKFFPAESAGGVTFLHALAGPYSHTGIRFCATGGVTTNNLANYLSAPLVNAVGGSWLATKARIEHEQWSDITRDCQRALEQIKQITGAE